MGFFSSLFGINNNTAEKARERYTGDQTTSRVPDLLVEFGDEMPARAFGNNLDDSYSFNGVQLNTATNTMRVLYEGILAKDGAQDVYAVIGYGDNVRWENTEYYPMHKIGDQTFDLVFPVKKTGNINMAFKDGADHWDNNSGKNYTYDDRSYRGS